MDTEYKWDCSKCRHGKDGDCKLRIVDGANMNEGGITNLATAVLARAARDYSPHNDNVIEFLNSPLFGFWCDMAHLDERRTRLAITQDWGR